MTVVGGAVHSEGGNGERTVNVVVPVSKNTSGSARDFAVGSAEALRTKWNVTGVANVTIVV